MTKIKITEMYLMAMVADFTNENMSIKIQLTGEEFPGTHKVFIPRAFPSVRRV